MKRTLLKSKIHRAKVTRAFLEYEGSISIDPVLMEAAQLIAFEKVEIYNCNNGERFSTYVIEGQKGEIGLNGAAARKVYPGDLVIIAAYAEFEEAEIVEFKPQLVFVDSENKIIDPSTRPLPHLEV
jgi:aspartate 1-decarboxylase